MVEIQIIKIVYNKMFVLFLFNFFNFWILERREVYKINLLNIFIFFYLVCNYIVKEVYVDDDDDEDDGD